MNSEMGFSLRTPASDGACLRDDPRGARHWGASSRRTLHMRAIGVKRALHCVTELAAASYGLRASPRLFFSHSISITYRCGPCGVVGDAFARRPSAAANPQGFVGHRHRRWRDNASSPRYTAMSVWTN